MNMQEMIKDGFVMCPHCNCNLCYTQNINGEETWMCLGCGYTSTTLMKEGTDTEKQVSSKQPKLYQDLKFVDKDRYVWYPAVMTVPDKGMVYVDGASAKEWQWAATPMRKLTEKEQRMKKYKNSRYVADTERTKFFGEGGFVQAAEAIGMFDES